jgi:hypothetical protein
VGERPVVYSQLAYGLVFRPEVIIQNLLNWPWAGLWEGSEW